MGVRMRLNKSLSWLRPKGICDSGVDIFRKVKFSETEMSSRNLPATGTRTRAKIQNRI